MDVVPKPRWTTASYLIYAGGLTVLGAALGALAYLSSQYGDAANPLAAICAAMLHPSPGLADYPPGPPQAYLSSGDRNAIAGWILQLSHDAK